MPWYRPDKPHRYVNRREAKFVGHILTKGEKTMKKLFVLLAVIALAALLAPAAMATNGTNLIGVGPISRSMGGVGVAAPQDAISAVFANPAAMCFGPYCPGAQADFAGTYFDPTVSGKITSNNPGFGFTGTRTASSQMNPSVVPAVAVVSPINENWRFGIGAYGVSGMGVDYKGKDPAFQDTYTKLEVMKFAPNVAYLVTPNLSLGLSVSVDYQNLDLGAGSAHDYAVGAQLGALYNVGMFNFGISYITPQGVTHKRVADFPVGFPPAPDGTWDDLELEAPQTVAFGVSAAPSSNWLVEFDVKWHNWADATGYKDFDWEDQWVYALGVQFKPTDALALRAGYNYSKNPVKEHQGFDPAGSTNVQGVAVNNVAYEGLRIIGFPAIVEQHVTLGLGYNLSQSVILNLSYMHAFEESIKEASAGDAIIYQSDLEEDSFSFGISWRF
jgi:long-chain fatty acid transport protein